MARCTVGWVTCPAKPGFHENGQRTKPYGFSAGDSTSATPVSYKPPAAKFTRVRGWLLGALHCFWASNMPGLEHRTFFLGGGQTPEQVRQLLCRSQDKLLQWLTHGAVVRPHYVAYCTSPARYSC